jgi:hypothetical protein
MLNQVRSSYSKILAGMAIPTRSKLNRLTRNIMAYTNAPSHPRPRTILEKVTPARAKELWEGHIESRGEQRKSKDSRISEYAATMLRGRWNETPTAAIGIGPDGSIVDGAHRIQAVIRANTTVSMWIAYDVDPGVFAVLDYNVPRTPFQVSVMAGSSYTAAQRASINMALVPPEKAVRGAIPKHRDPSDINAIDRYVAFGMEVAFPSFRGSSNYQVQGFRAAFIRAALAYPEQEQLLSDAIYAVILKDSEPCHFTPNQHRVSSYMHDMLSGWNTRSSPPSDLYKSMLRGIWTLMKDRSYTSKYSFITARSVVPPGFFALPLDASGNATPSDFISKLKVPTRCPQILGRAA